MHLIGKFTTEKELNNLLDLIYSKSKIGAKFSGLLEIAFNRTTIITAMHNIKSNSGMKTSGVDGTKISKYLQMDIEEVILLIQEKVKKYKAKPVKRIYIDKSNGKKRPIGIPSTIDKIIQECIRIVIEPICEGKFYDHSYGFRPYRTTKDAVKIVLTRINSSRTNIPKVALEGDIKGYFDNINHRVLMNKLWKIGIRDKRILAIIKEMLKAGYIDNGKKYKTNRGTPQGGILSPLLANIYLNDFDWLISRKYSNPKTDWKCSSDFRKLLIQRGIHPRYLTRYADDWIIQTSSIKEAHRLKKYIAKYYEYKLKIELSEEKTLITDMEHKPTQFLGFNLVAEPKRNSTSGKLVGKAKPNMKRVIEQTRAITKRIRDLKTTPYVEKRVLIIEEVNMMIIGVANYWSSGICSKAFRYIDNCVRKCSYTTFKKRYKKEYRKYFVKLDELDNRPQRHKGYNTYTFTEKYKGMNIGITKAFLTHSNYPKSPYNLKMTPYTSEGRKLYQSKSKKNLPLDRPTLYTNKTLAGSMVEKSKKYNFEYFMNREYAFNRDKGKCKCCGTDLIRDYMHCHHIKPKIPINIVNKVNNLAWVCIKCHQAIHNKKFDINVIKTTKIRNKIINFKEKLIAKL